MESTNDFHVADPENLFSEEGDEDRLQAGWRTKESDKRRYSEARDGDDLLIPFECDFCVFAKITGRPLVLENISAEDVFLSKCIRRVTLDAFWSRARSTVAANTRTFREMIALSASLGFEPPYEPPGPLPSYDQPLRRQGGYINGGKIYATRSAFGILCPVGHHPKISVYCVKSKSSQSGV